MTTQDTFADSLQAAGIRRVQVAEQMSRHTSWRIGGPAEYLCVVEDEAQLRNAVEVAVRFEKPWLVLGGGNNILVSDEGIEGLVILNRLRGIAIEQREGGAELLCGSGVFFAKAAQFSARQGFSGMEWGIAVPGTVGGGVVNNAGAHDSDVGRQLVSAMVIDAGGRGECLSATDLAYRYRQSALKRPHTTQTRLVVTSCRFRLTPDDASAALSRIEALRAHRLRTQPVKESTAGSTFKNPPGHHAGGLIDRAGLKGHRAGDAQISLLHANFIVNLGSASAADAIALIHLAQSRVRELFGVDLEPEVQFVGRWSEDLLRTVLGVAA